MPTNAHTIKIAVLALGIMLGHAVRDDGPDPKVERMMGTVISAVAETIATYKA